MTDLFIHAERLAKHSLSSLAAEVGPVASFEAVGWSTNLARQKLDTAAHQSLIAYAESAGIPETIQALFAGHVVNPSEDRPALHWALRSQDALTGLPGEVQQSLKAADVYADAVRSSAVTAANGQPFQNIVHIGIGGSDFGPRLLADAFELERDKRFTLRFCANLDPIDLDLALDGLSSENTLVIGVSKSFGTEETLYNLTRARNWLHAALGDKTARHLALVTSRPDRAQAWLNGAEVTTFPLPESVGGRFSIWSNGSLALRIALGPEIIDAFRAGAAAMDAHLKAAPLGENLPVRLALLDYWNRSVLGYPMRVLLAYARRLRLLPTYLQQLEMESNGKSVRPDGQPASGKTAPALWGGEGSVGQHSYHQWLHQGSDAVPMEFILAPDANAEADGRTALTAHALAQAEVLANGRSLDTVRSEEPGLADEIAAQKVHKGGRPSTFLTHADFGPHALGSLIALYEHRTYLAGHLWGINPFDQWGVEAGKTMAGRIKTKLAARASLSDPTSDRIARQITNDKATSLDT